MAIAGLKAQLKNRHLQMIALGGVIGTGLFFGSAKSIALTGPSIILSYILGGILIYIIIRALGEMSVYDPSCGSFSEYANKYLNPYAGFIAGWNAWFQYTVVCMVELSAVAYFLDYWLPWMPHWRSCLILLIAFTLINILSVRIFGEFEFYFAGIKIVAIMAMLVFSTYLIIRHGINPDIYQYKNPSLFFAGAMKGFITSLVIVVFAFGGTEFVTIAAAEAENPARNIPTAINGVIVRIILFYVLTMLAIICLYPYQQLADNISPFVDVFSKTGIPIAAEIMNIVAITAALSAFNSCLYSSSRMLLNLGNNKHAFKHFATTSNNGVPINAIIITSIIILFGVFANYAFPEHALMYLLMIATASIIITWFIILLTHFGFRKYCKQNNVKLGYKAILFPYLNLIAIVVLIAIVAIMLNMPDMQSSVYITPLWLSVLSIFYVIKKVNERKTG